MLIRVRPPGYQVGLWLFLQNSSIGTVRRVGRDAVQISDASEARIAEAVALWQGLNPLADLELEPHP
jgi:ABC-type uncharacterized transport system YnjBCD permease subunit